MKKTLLFCCLIYSLMACQSETIPLYVGTYTSGDSEGIYTLPFNQTTGEVGEAVLVAKTVNPSYMVFSPDKKYLYAVGETNEFKNKNTGLVKAFKVMENGELVLINSVDSGGAHPCHVAINPEGTQVAVSNYSGGTISIFNISENGALEEAVQVFDHNTTTEKSHVHSAAFINNDLFVADLGRNSIFQYNKNQGLYKLKSSSVVPFEPNSGPRHFTFTKDHDFLYVINEYANSVSSSKFENGEFDFIAHTSTLDNNQAESFCADIHLSPSGNHLYGSNRGENSIVVFDRNTENGELSKTQSISVEGDWPRNFTLSPNGKFLLVANQKSENISVFSVDEKSGKLTFEHSFKLPIPVCLIF